MAGESTADVLDPTAQGGSATPPVAGGAAAKPPATPPVAEQQPPGADGGDVGELEPGITEKGGRKFISMPYDSFKSRVSKMARSQNKADQKELIKMFGTADPKALAAIKKQFDEFKADADKRQREEMTDRQKLEADRDAAVSAKEVAERRAERARDHVRIARTDQHVNRAASEHVAPEKTEMALAMFRVALMGMSKRRADKLIGHEADWFKAFVGKNPDCAKGSKTAAAAPVTEPVEKKPASNGISPKKGKPNATQPNAAGGKAVKDMSASELRAYAAANNIKLPVDMRLLG